MKPKTISIWFAFLTMVIVISDFLSDILAIQMFSFGAITFTGGEFVFPIVYMANDILCEVYGYKTTKKVIWFSLAINVYALSAITLVSFLAGTGTPMYQYIIGDYGLASAIVVAVAGFTAFLVGSFSNAYIMSKLKAKHGNRLFALRAVVSTVAGELLDSSAFGLVACVFGLYAWSDFVPLTVTVVIIKTIVETACLPITTMLVKKAKTYENESRCYDLS